MAATPQNTAVTLKCLCDHIPCSTIEKDEDKFHSYVSFFDKNAFTFATEK